MIADQEDALKGQYGRLLEKCMLAGRRVEVAINAVGQQTLTYLEFGKAYELNADTRNCGGNLSSLLGGGGAHQHVESVYIVDGEGIRLPLEVLDHRFTWPELAWLQSVVQKLEDERNSKKSQERAQLLDSFARALLSTRTDGKFAVGDNVAANDALLGEKTAAMISGVYTVVAVGPGWGATYDLKVGEIEVFFVHDGAMALKKMDAVFFKKVGRIVNMGTIGTLLSALSIDDKTIHYPG